MDKDLYRLTKEILLDTSKHNKEVFSLFCADQEMLNNPRR